MEHHAPAWSLSGKQLAGLVYVAIALVVVGQAALQTQSNVQWFSSTANLTVYIENVTFHLDTTALGYAFVTVRASVDNPGDFNGLRVTDANYAVFVNSTSQSFSVQGSTIIGMSDFTIQKTVPSRRSLNITVPLPLLSDVVSPLKTFISTHQADLVTFVGVTLFLDSSYGRLSIPYCYEIPGPVFAVCPPARPPPRGGFGGGG